MVINPLHKQKIVQAVVVTVFVVGFLVAQLATTQHDIDHHFHKHTDLCDSFIDFGHHSTTLITTVVPVIAFETHFVDYTSEPQHAFHRETGTFRIRGPPSLLV